MDTKTTLFAFLIAAMILPFSGMNFDDIQEAFGMQHIMIDGMHSHDVVSNEINTEESTQVVRDSKATSFDPIYFEHSHTSEIPDRTVRNHLNFR